MFYIAYMVNSVTHVSLVTKHTSQKVTAFICPGLALGSESSWSADEAWPLWASSSGEGGCLDGVPWSARRGRAAARGCSQPARSGRMQRLRGPPQLTQITCCVHFHIAAQLHLTAEVRARVGLGSVEQVEVVLSPSSWPSPVLSQALTQRPA